MVFGALFAGKRYHAKKYAFVLMIVCGVALFLYKNKKARAEEGGFGLGEILLVSYILLLTLFCFAVVLKTEGCKLHVVS